MRSSDEEVRRLTKENEELKAQAAEIARDWLHADNARLTLIQELEQVKRERDAAVIAYRAAVMPTEKR